MALRDVLVIVIGGTAIVMYLSLIFGGLRTPWGRIDVDVFPPQIERHP